MSSINDLLTNPQIRIFLCGVFGSAIVEALTIFRCYQKASGLPKRYGKVGFWIVRSIIALGGGVLATLYDPASLLLAAHIGASTPLIIATMAETLPEDNESET